MEGTENPDMPPMGEDDEGGGEEAPKGGGLFGKIGTKYVGWWWQWGGGGNHGRPLLPACLPLMLTML